MKPIVLLTVISFSATLLNAQHDMGLKAIIRGDTTQKKVALVFTGDEFADGGQFIQSGLRKEKIKASFFLTGNFYRNKNFKKLILGLISGGHYLGSHSDKHLLYCDWIKRDSLLVTKNEFETDLRQSYKELDRFGISTRQAVYFLPPYEWYNDSIVSWTHQSGLQLVNFTPGTRSTADYTYPEMASRYVDSKSIYQSIIDHEKKSVAGLNGFILLVHIGTDPRRKDKFYRSLPRLIKELKNKGYQFVKINELLSHHPG
ncbi:MAG: polysaccharide deacetylase family protein [Chitinophagaceae bacterium]|nr:polysaccharide deacetylase family protein [Chitinophagaceae bacterium]